MNSQQIRSFIGGRHKDDRGLYVSTGGFSKDARYEADCSTIPLTLWTLDDLVRALVENYEQVDIKTKLLVPLRKRICLHEGKPGVTVIVVIFGLIANYRRLCVLLCRAV